MLPVRRTAARAARQLRSTQRQQQQRRFAHDDHHHHASAVSEPIGGGFWLAVGVIPVSYAVYTLSQPGADGKSTRFTELIESYSTTREVWERRNTLHTAMIEQAAFDRNLFQSERPSGYIPLKYPEALNAGSPINVPAGHYSNIDHVIAHYQEENRKQAEKTAARLAKGEQID